MIFFPTGATGIHANPPASSDAYESTEARLVHGRRKHVVIGSAPGGY